MRRLLLPLLVLLASALPLQALPGLQRYPYVQPVTGTTAGVAFRTSEACRGWVEFGPTEALGKRVPAGDGAHHYAVLTGLSPGSEVFYRVGSDNRPLSAVYSFRTAAPPGRAFRFDAVGDCGAGNSAQRDLGRLILADDPELVVVPGDVVYERGTEHEFETRFFQAYRSLLVRIPFFPALGNHDARTRDGGPYLANFYLPGSERWYSFDWGDVHFVALDSTTTFGPGTPQDRWLERDLAATKQRWKVVFFHHPPYSASPAHGSSMSIRRAWSPVFARHGVDLVICGHNHVYERTRPIDGVTYLVTGGGGASLYPTGTAPWSLFSRSLHHYVRLQASPEAISWEAVDRDGQVFDRFRLEHEGRVSRAPVEETLSLE